MSNVSAFWKSYSLAPSRNVFIGAVFNSPSVSSYFAVNNEGNAFTLTGSDAIVSAKITQPFCSTTGLSFGEACTGELELVLANPALTDLNIPESKLVWKNAQVAVYIGVTDDEGNFYTQANPQEWSNELMGRYYIYDVSSDDGWNTIQLKGYDYMSRLNVKYEPNISFPATPNDIYNDINGQYFYPNSGCFSRNYAPYTNTQTTNDVYPETQLAAYREGTVKDYLGWLAGLIGTNAIVVGEGELLFVRPYFDSTPSNNYQLAWNDQYMNGLDVKDTQPFVLNSITSGTEDNVLTSGTGTGVSFTNPLMTQAILDSLLSELKGFTYYPLSCEWRCFPPLKAGNAIYVQQANEVYYPTLMMNQVVTVDGGYKATIDAYQTAVDVAVAASPTEQALNRVYSNLQQAIKDATELLKGAKGGIFRLADSDGDGINDGFLLADSATATAVTRCIIANYEGIGLSQDGGNTYVNAITHNGINASAINTGQLNAERILVNGNTLSDYFDVGLNADDKIQITLGARDSNIRLAEVNDKISFIDGDDNPLLSLTSTTFDMESLSHFRLGNAQLIVQPNGSVSLVPYP